MNSAPEHYTAICNTSYCMMTYIAFDLYYITTHKEHQEK